jgi:uncharacterized RDD family membrane protein YckC
MRCPKCHYLSFEPEPRCRNCGYDLAFEPGDLSVSSEPAARQTADALSELEIRPDGYAAPAQAQAASPSVDTGALPLFLQGLPDARTEVAAPPAASTHESEIKPRSTAHHGANPAELDELVDVEIRPAASVAVAEPDEPEPLVKLPAAPRAPLSVRRPTPAPGRVREKYQAHRVEPVQQIGLLERDLLNDDSQDTPWPLIAPDPVPETPDVSMSAAVGDVAEPVGAGRRLEAALVDVLFLGSINVAIVWLTLQRCELTWSQIGLLPILPMAALLFLLDAMYLLMFTATNGQTVGKMAAGIRVVGDAHAAHDRVTLKQAVLRAVLTFPSVLVLGAGFFPALLGRGLALHDRFTHTRVVRA